MNKVAAIVLAGGKGERMRASDALKSKIVNKVVLPLGNKPMILYTIDLLESLKVSIIIVVVGFAKESVIDVLGSKVFFVEQKERLGTGHAVNLALKKLDKLDKNVHDVLVLNGDDSAFYKKETIVDLIKKHNKSRASITFLTIELDKPAGLGRVVKDNSGKVVAIIEDSDASLTQRKIKEINPACYMFSLEFLHKYLGRIKKSKISGEYYLTGLIDVAIKNNEKVETVRVAKLLWRGINTTEELKEAERLFLSSKN